MAQNTHRRGQTLGWVFKGLLTLFAIVAILVVLGFLGIVAIGAVLVNPFFLVIIAIAIIAIAAMMNYR